MHKNKKIRIKMCRKRKKQQYGNEITAKGAHRDSIFI